MHQTSPPTLQVLLGWARCIWSQIFCLLPSFPSYPKEFGVFHPGTAPSVPGEESSVLRPAVGWFGFLGASSSRRTRTQEHPNPKGISCSAGRLSWRCHCHTKPWGHWGQREGQTTGFDLHRAKPQRGKIIPWGQSLGMALECAGWRGDDLGLKNQPGLRIRKEGQQ